MKTKVNSVDFEKYILTSTFSQHSHRIQRNHGRGGAAGFLVTVSGMARRDPAESLHNQSFGDELGRNIQID